MNAEQAPGADMRSERMERLAACLSRAMAGELSALDPVVAELNPLLWHVARAQGLTEEDAAAVVPTSWVALVRPLPRRARPPPARPGRPGPVRDQPGDPGHRGVRAARGPPHGRRRPGRRAD